MKISRRTKYLVRGIMGLVLVGLLGIAAFIGFSETTEREVALAKELHSAVKERNILTESQQIFNRIGHNAVTMNVYGVHDQGAQDQIAAAMKSVLDREKFRGHVHLIFFSSRQEAVKSTTPEGWTVMEGKKGSLVRAIEIQ